MLHCPYCGTKANEDEHYCIKCGRALPNDITDRLHGKKQFNKFWYIPISLFTFLLLSSGIYYFILQNQTAEAKTLYEQGEQRILDEDYEAARELFADAVSNKENFAHAATSLQFMNKALDVQKIMEDANTFVEEQDFQQALSLINEAESDLKNFNGDAVKQLIDTIITKRDTIKVEQLKNELEKETAIDDLKLLLWEAASIDNEEAESMELDIRNQIIDYSFSKASNQLNNRHFNDAQILVEDGLKYAPDSERLQSLQSTIEKEKEAFETAQEQRMEQAIDTAEKEQQLNETDAIELISATVESNDKKNIVIKGEVESVATIPIHSVLIEYVLLTDNGTEILSDEVYIYPDTLYPEEKGQFEYTHFDSNDYDQDVDVEVRKITWYTN
ncbi:tetratricopeptide (TPR) repeat protein [Virgibacillus natechei]|uniref:Tetratricopeptide (TPR) repeat protein n=1 Tax=Virgibacillus natechei TaxID=1216297 RepID=A0ABS4IBH0_9BACI|nr:zinc ribbon domain-containing protein [Virgibacillus natechei]MBP1968272.1 tetratricopeptide (TPR) repeat protein [Virgibacillus natechei]UZD14462.1 zinc ribbon domain-containing protein [Virgibacillus natechei]